MLAEVQEAKDFLLKKYGDLDRVIPGIYSIPTNTSKGPAFMRVGISDDMKMHHFDLWLDEKLTETWY